MEEVNKNHIRDYTENYTAFMHKLFWENAPKFQKLYCREDIDSALNDVKEAENIKDAYPYRKIYLDAICEKVGMDADCLLQDKSLLNSIPAREDLREQLLEFLHCIYQKFPSSTDYMERIVHRLAPEYKDDSVRTAILKKFILGTGDSKLFKTGAILNWSLERMGEKERQDYENATGEEKMRLAVSKLDDSIFTDERMNVELGNLEILRLMIGQLDNCANMELTDSDGKPYNFQGLETSNKTKEGIQELLKDAGIEPDPGSSTTDMLKIIAANAEKESNGTDFNSHMDTFFPSAEEDFSKQMKNMFYKNRSGSREKVAERFRTTKRDARNKKRQDWDLLRLCSDLADGKFKNNGRKTRVYLYYFAFMFDMSVQLQDSKGQNESDKQRDIIKNLFEDYYSDNIIRYLEDEYFDPKSAGNYEKEPTGEGINFKNFAEVVYLYYLQHKELSGTPGGRIKKAESLIGKCIRNAKPKPVPRKNHMLKENIQERTEYYKKMYLNKVFHLREDDLEIFILQNYQVLSPDGAKGSRMEISSEESSAYDQMNQTLEELESVYEKSVQVSQLMVEVGSVREKDMEKFLEEAKLSYDIMFDWSRLSKLLHKKYANDTDFLRIIDHLTERLTFDFNYLGASKKQFLSQMLHMLYHHSTPEKPMKMRAAREFMRKNNAAANGGMITEGADLLEKMGFDVKRGTDAHGESLFWLGKRSYGDERLDAIIRRVSGRYWNAWDPVAQSQLDILIGKHILSGRKITRSTLLAVYASYYKTMIFETASMDSFPDLYHDFEESANPILENARYQPLSEKNILDMYVVLSLYDYILENGKEIEEQELKHRSHKMNA